MNEKKEKRKPNKKTKKKKYKNDHLKIGKEEIKINQVRSGTRQKEYKFKNRR